MSAPLTPQILTQSAITMLVQVLAEDNSASVNGLEIALLEDDFFGNRREQLRVRWEGDKGTGQRDFVLYGLPLVTWSEKVNPNLPAPAPVLFVESDLPDAFTMLTEGFVASGRRRGERPAWFLREDWTKIPNVSERRKEKGENDGKSREWRVERGENDDGATQVLSTLLEKTAAFHALHWGAGKVLDDVYPWLPRFSNWLESEETRAKREETATTLRAMARMPQTIIHGTWQADFLRLQDGELLVEGWDRLMVGPAAWDIYCLLESLATEDWEGWIRTYCGYLEEKVAEFDGTEEFVRLLLALQNG